MAFFDKLKKNKDDPKKKENVDPKEEDAKWATSKEKPVDEPKKETPAKKKESKNMATKPAAKESASKNKVWHISKREEDGMWQIKAEGAERATKLFRTKAEAEEYVKTLKSNNDGSRVVKHKKTGEFQKKK
jgi:hypothetical protein